MGGIIGGIGSIVGGVMSANAQDDAADAASDSARLQYLLGKRLLDAQLGKTVDARGNVIEYDEATQTWRVIPSEMTKDLIDASDLEEFRRLTDDASMRRTGMVENFDRRGREGQVADSYLSQIEGESPYTREGIEGALMSRALFGIDHAYDDVTGDAARSAIRTQTNFAPVMAQLASQRAEDTKGALLDAKVQGLGLYENLQSSRDDRLTGQYNTFASRASNIDNTPFMPNSQSGQLSSVMQGRQGNAIGAGQTAMSGIGSGYGLKSKIGAINSQSSPFPDLFAGIGGLFEAGQNWFSGAGKRTQGNSGSF